MRRTLLALALPLSLLLPAAAQDTRPTSRPDSQPAKKAALPPLGAPAGVYGAGVTLKQGHPLAEAAKQVARLHGAPVRVEADIKDVCRKKGCWMVLAAGDLEVRVRFKDYAFFVPRDASGRKAIAEGILTEKEISEEEARHYAEESGDPEAAKEIHGPQKVLAFTATGVEILGKDTLPPVADAAAPDALARLADRLAKAQAAAPAGRAVKGLADALAVLRATPGARTTEFSLCTEQDGWLVFADARVEEPFSRGWAVQEETGAVVRY